MSSATLSPNHTWMDCLSTLTCCSLITVTTMVYTSIVSRAFSICFPIFLNLLPGFNTTKSNQRRPLPSREFLPPSFWIYCNSAVRFNWSVLHLALKSFRPVTLTLAPLLPPLILHHMMFWHTLCYRPLSNCSFKPHFLPGHQLLRWEGDHTHVCFCGTCFSTSSPLADPYHSFKNRADKLLHFPVFWIYPCFHNSLQLPWHFFFNTKYWAKACR